MLTVRKLHAKATAELPHRRFYKILTPSATGILLGPETAVVKGTMLHGQERRILALLSAAHHRPVDPAILRSFEAAERLTQQGQLTTAMITLILSGFAPLPETEPERGDALWRLFAAAELLDSGIDPADLIRGWGYGEALAKFNPDQPRVPARQSGGGQWTGGEDGGDSGAGGGGDVLDLPDPNAGADQPQGEQVAANCQLYCRGGGTYGTTAMYNVDGIDMCRDCAVKYLGLNLSGLSAKRITFYLERYLIN